MNNAFPEFIQAVPPALASVPPIEFPVIVWLFPAPIRIEVVDDVLVAVWKRLLLSMVQPLPSPAAARLIPPDVKLTFNVQVLKGIV